MPFSQHQADRAINFFELVLKHTQDEYYGKPFLLTPWQVEATSRIFGNVNESGLRLIEQVYMELPKKTGKTEWAAGLLLYVLVTTTSQGCQCYGAATATRQALNVYRAAASMVQQSELLSDLLRIYRSTSRIVKRQDPDSFYAAVAADGDFTDGVNPAFTIADEVHRWRTRKQMENWDVLANGGITRRQTLCVGITTAGVREQSPLAWRLHEKTRRLSEGIVSDPTFYGRIYAADPNDDPAEPATWIKANPSLIENGGFIQLGKIREKYESAVSEGDLTSFRRYFLNLWDQHEERVVPMQKWDNSRGPWESQGLQVAAPEDSVRPLHPDVLRHFIDRQCWIGVDLSMTTDMTAISLVFPADDAFEVLPFYWVPSEQVKNLEVKLGMPLASWIRSGYLEATPGGAIDYREVRERLEWASRMFRVEEICWDPWNSRELSSQMVDSGHRCWEVRQSYAQLSETTKRFLALVANGKILHGGNPILRWNVSCAVLDRDRRDNVMFSKPSREKGTARIDGLSATVNALSRAIAPEGECISYRGLGVVG